MSSIKVLKPYKITREKLKRYASHYEIPAERSMIVPVKVLGEEVSCDIHWEDEEGNLHRLENKIFLVQNLVALNPMLEARLYEIWEQHYKDK